MMSAWSSSWWGARARSVVVLGALAAVLACGKSQPEVGSDPAAKPKPAASQVDNGAGGGMGPLLADDQVRIVEAPATGDVETIVREERARQAALGRSLIVYAGAKWCEPCQHFHHAAAEGKLDKAFPKLTVLEFDVDNDRERLATAGYSSRFIPLFIVPDKDGKPTDKRMEGSVKGEGAVDEIVPRLRKLLES
jgi:thiol-disulfide isomerase/thioredoxin